MKMKRTIAAILAFAMLAAQAPASVLAAGESMGAAVYQEAEDTAVTDPAPAEDLAPTEEPAATETPAADEPTAAPTQQPAPEETAAPTPTAEPASSPEPTAAPEPTATATPVPELTPAPTDTPAETPETTETEDDSAQQDAPLYAAFTADDEAAAVSSLPADTAFTEMCQAIFGTDDLTNTDTATYAEVYVGKGNSGESTAVIGTEARPYGSLNEAYQGLSSKNVSGAVIHLVASYAEANDPISIWPQLAIPVIIISDDPTAKLTMAGSWSFMANTGFYNVTVDLAYANNAASVMYANGNTLVFGGRQANNFAIANDSPATRAYPTLFGAGNGGTETEHQKFDDANLQVYGGTWSQIFGGGERYSDITDTATLTIDGGYYTDPNDESTLAKDAVTFDDTHLLYMEGSSNIYGGGAGDYAKMSAATSSNVGNAVVTVSNLTTQKYITPCGGWLLTSASVTLDNVDAKGVNARSEGQAADKVDITINNNSNIKERVGSIGGEKSTTGITKTYIQVKTINEFSITVDNSHVGNIIVKDGDFGGKSYNNNVDGVSVTVTNHSTIGQLSMGQLPSGLSAGIVKQILIEDSTIPWYGSGTNFQKIESIILRNVGTENAPLKWERNTFGGTYTSSGVKADSLTLDNSYVDFTVDYTAVKELVLQNGSIVTLEPDITLRVGNFVNHGTSNGLVMHNGASVKMSGVPQGDGITVTPILKKEESGVEINWLNDANDTSNNLNIYFTQSSDTNWREYRYFVPTMNVNKWTNYEIAQKTYVYVDQVNGHDDVTKYGGGISEEQLGHDPNYPVQTLEKAYELCTREDMPIVLCGPYEIDVAPDNDAQLFAVSQEKEFPVTITSVDNQSDYTDHAWIRFYGDAKDGRVSLPAALTFDNIRMISALPSSGTSTAYRVRIFSNGHPTVYGAGVSVTSENGSALDLYGGAYNAGVESTNLTVSAQGIGIISASGYGTNVANVYVGDPKAIETQGEVIDTAVAKLNVEFNKDNGKGYTIQFYGNAYGSVEQNIHYSTANTAAGITANSNANSGRTVYGNYTTKISCDYQLPDACYYSGNPAPTGITVKGTTTLTDDGKINSSNIVLADGNYKTVNIEVGGKGGNVRLFSDNTVAENVNWKLTGTFTTLYGADTNKSFTVGTDHKLSVLLDSTGNTAIRTYNNKAELAEEYCKNPNISITLENFAIENVIERLRGFGSVTFDNSQCTVNDALQTQQLFVKNNSRIIYRAAVTVGQEEKPGTMELKSQSYLTVNKAFNLWGSMAGETDAAQAGQLINNNTPDGKTTDRITVHGTVTGITNYGTDYDSASIQVTEQTQGTEYICVPALKISCDPAAEDGAQQNRIWTVTNSNSRNLIFVNGTLDATAAEYQTHDGSTPELAYATLDEAYLAVLNKGTIVICGDISVSKWPITLKEVTITSKVQVETENGTVTYDYFAPEKAKFKLTEQVELRDATTFDNLCIDVQQRASSPITIGASGNKLVMGHEGDEKSIIMTNGKLNIGGGTNTTKAQVAIAADLTIYAGTYGIASGTNSFENQHNSTPYSSVSIKIYGGTYDEIRIKGNLYDNFSSGCLKISPELYVENATVNSKIEAVENDYQNTALPYKIHIGPNMKFASDAKVVTGIHNSAYGSNGFNVELTVDGTGGTPYTIPSISGGKETGGADIHNAKSTVSVKNATVANYYGGNTGESSYTQSITSELTLLEGAKIENLYFGGITNAGASAIVTVKADTAVIDNISPGSQSGTAEAPAYSELIFDGVGQDTAYKLAAKQLQGLTKITLKNSANVDITSAGPDISAGELDIAGGSLTYRRNVLRFTGNLTGGTAETPATIYASGAPNYTIKGTVSGITKLKSLNADPSDADNAVTGKFYYGAQIRATANDNHSASNFRCLQTDTASTTWKDMPFTAGTGDTMDLWNKPDEESTDKRTQIYVSEQDGDDNNPGTLAAPVNTLAQAYKQANKLYAANQVAYEIILMDDVTLKGTFSDSLAADLAVTIKSYNANGSSKSGLNVNSGFSIPANTTLDDIVIISTLPSTSAELFANGHTVVCTQNLETQAVAGQYPVIYGGTGDATPLTKTDLTVLGGKWNRIFGASKTAAVDSANLTVGGSVDTLNISNDAEEATGVFGGGLDGKAGKVQLTVNGGSYYRILGGGQNTNAVTGPVTLDFNYGTASRVYGGGQHAAVNGDVLVNIGQNSDGKTAQITEIYRGGGLNASLTDGHTATTHVYANTVIDNPQAQFAAGGYSGTLEMTELYIEGGTISCDIYAGGWGAGTTGTYGTVTKQTQVTVTGGTISGNIYGGGKLAFVNNAASNAQANVTVSGGTVTGSIYGGGNAAGVNQSHVVINSTVGGNVFGGSQDVTAEALQVQETSEVTLNTCTVGGSVFGGSDTAGRIHDSVTVNVNGEVTVNGNGIFGGGSKAETPCETTVNVTGTVTGNVFGGGKGELKTQSTLARTLLSTFTGTDLVDARAASTHVAISGTVNGDVFGGGEYATVGDTANTAETVTNVTVNGTVNGRVYGGGKGEKDKEYAQINGDTLVTLDQGGTVTTAAGNDTTGAVFGGGQNAPVSGSTKVQVTGGNYTNVFGGNDASGKITGTAQAEMTGGTVAQLYAAGQNADTENAAVTVTGGTVQTVYGGGNAATVTADTNLTVGAGAKVTTVFAGNNHAPMAIQPTLSLAGYIPAVYCGGNEGVMTGKYTYTFNFPELTVDELYAGCNNTGDTPTADTALQLVSGTYNKVFGGNNQTGNMQHTSVTLSEGANANALTVSEVYGGGNQADAVNTAVKVEKYTKKDGKPLTVYGGGNQATVTGSVMLTLGNNSHTETPYVDAMYCGNNAADMAIAPTIDLQSGTIAEFYGGGNQGAMTAAQIAYAFDSNTLTIDTIYGGGNQAGVTNAVTLTIKNGNYTTIYGGSNEQGTVGTATVNVQGNVGTASVTGAIYGGGHGNGTKTLRTNVNLQNGTVYGNVYGGSGYGSVDQTHVTAQTPDNSSKVVVHGSVYGAGYGEISSATETNVTINLPLEISTTGNQGDVTVTEDAKESDTSGESHASAQWNTAKENGSYIDGNVFGGGDMGQVGSGFINASSNTAVIEQEGTTKVQVLGGYINGSVFGGGNGQPADNSSYTLYMGTVFGKSQVEVTGGYVDGSIFGCGQQSRTYAGTDGKASDVNIAAASNTPVLIGGSIFGGGNKGSSSNQNASVATVYGDTHVKLSGTANVNTPIYMLSTETSGGGIYGDGNLCLVSGKKYVELENFSCGNTNKLKTFYSLQRADVVTLTGSRVVLLGAVDLVADTADDTLYSINRVGQLNLKNSSTIKVVKTVNLLAELTSDEAPTRQFINRGNNTGNATVTPNGYTGHNGGTPSAPLKETEVTQYIADYNAYIAGNKPSNFSSINVVCVANGGYLEVKKSASEYGPVSGLFTLQLVHANVGEGGGFVYASIDGKKLDDGTYATGNFVCVTEDSSSQGTYMNVYHDVGGNYTDGKYEYYIWYLKGNKYNYDVDLTGYIGTQDTAFEKALSVPVDTTNKIYYALLELNQSNQVNGYDPEIFKNGWEEQTDKDSGKIAVEVKLLTNVRGTDGTIKQSTQDIGFIGYWTSDGNLDGNAADGSRVWGIWRKVNDKWTFQNCLGTNSDGNSTSFAMDDSDILASLDTNVVGAQLKFILHKGTAMTTEFRNLPFELKLAEVKDSDYTIGQTGDKQIQIDSCTLLTENLNVSAIRLVPTQAAYLGAGKLYGGVPSDAKVAVTEDSAFTMQFVTKYIPSAFGTGNTAAITETLKTSYNTLYLLDTNGVGYTLDENENLLHVSNQEDNTVSKYKFTKTDEGYTVTYLDASEKELTEKADGAEGGTETVRTYNCTATEQQCGFTMPQGTTITLIASIDEGTESYWYYYCDKDTDAVPLGDFTRMNTAGSTAKAGDNIYSELLSKSSTRITENMIFILDFSNVEASKWKESTITTIGHAILEHTYKTSSSGTADIMDFVSSEKAENEVKYTHETPKATGEFGVNCVTNGITGFTVNKETTTDENGAMQFDLTITPDNSVTNTRYEERQYAVILHLQNATGTQISFPEGTEIDYNGTKLPLGAGNKYVIVPVETVGTHTVSMRTTLVDLNPGTYTLYGKLYSTSAKGYYNSLPISDEASDACKASFTVAKTPVYALQVQETSSKAQNHLVTGGETLSFTVTAKSGTDNVAVALYKYTGSNYQKVELTSMFDDAQPVLNNENSSWTPTIQSEAEPGTYRLAFQYYDKTEYWDFIVK